MNFAPDQFLTTQRAMLETAQQIGAKLFEGASKVFELNMQTAHAAFSNATEAFTPPSDLESVRTGATAAASRASQDAREYAKRLYDIIARTNLEVVALLQKRTILEAPEAVAEAVSTATRNAPTGSAVLFPAA